MNSASGPPSFVARSVLLPLILVTFGGCLPSSCGRAESRSVTAADSTSRAIAATVPIDTLEHLWSSTGTHGLTLEYPRTLQFDANGDLWVSDASTQSLFTFGADGVGIGTTVHDLFDYPYLAGSAQHATYVFSPGRQRLQVLRDGTVADFVETPSPPKRGLLQYAYVNSAGWPYVKLLGDEFVGYVAALDTTGSIRWKTDLPGPTWWRAGGLRSWGDTLVSLRGYHPVVDLIGEDGRLDSLRLRGFDSPMLPRTRLYSRGAIDAPPLLIASADPAGEYLLVLNMRPGWLNVDVYDRSGLLQAVLTQPGPAFNKDFYPTDIAALQREPSSIDIAVSLIAPEPRIDYYRWNTHAGADRRSVP